MKKYIEIAKKKQNVSQNGLAKMLGITGGGLSHIANGGTVKEETLVMIARLAGEKTEKVLAEYELTKPHTPEVKKIWENIASYAMTAVCALPLLPVIHNYIYYVK